MTGEPTAVTNHYRIDRPGGEGRLLGLCRVCYDGSAGVFSVATYSASTRSWVDDPPDRAHPVHGPDATRISAEQAIELQAQLDGGNAAPAGARIPNPLFHFRFSAALDWRRCDVLREASGMRISLGSTHDREPGQGSIGDGVSLSLSEGAEPDTWEVQAWAHRDDYDAQEVADRRQRIRGVLLQIADTWDEIGPRRLVVRFGSDIDGMLYMSAGENESDAAAWIVTTVDRAGRRVIRSEDHYPNPMSIVEGVCWCVGHHMPEGRLEILLPGRSSPIVLTSWQAGWRVLE